MPARSSGKKQRRMGSAMPKNTSSDDMPIQEKAIAGLKCVIDPHTNISVYDMRLISELRTTPRSISLTFRPTSPFCPLAFDLARSMKGKLWELDGVRDVKIKVVGHYQEDRINRDLDALKHADETRKTSRKKRKRAD